MDNSQSSCTSSVPSELLFHGDPVFNDELETVNSLFFGNVEISDTHVESQCISDHEDNNESDNDCSRNEPLNADLSDNACPESFETDTDSEIIKQNNFKTNGCGCTRLYGKPCSAVIDWDQLVSYRLSCLEKSKDELDLVIKFQLFHHKQNDKVTVGQKRKSKDREKPRQSYFFAGNIVCRALFAFAHGINRKTVDALAKSLHEDGLEPRVHGNKNKMPKHALTLTDVENVKTFLINFGVQNGLPLPGRMPHFSERCTLLPSDQNKYDIHQLYCNAAEQKGYRKIASSTFLKIWKEQCPYLVVMKPATDLCVQCQRHVQTITKSGNLSEEEKTEKLEAYQSHIANVKSQRDYYRSQCENTKSAFNQLPSENQVRGQCAGLNDVTLHYSFDYAQQVFYPHQAQQVGPLYFKTPRKCQCFGVCCESSGTQIFYLIDEKFHSVGKGANSVASLLHHHFEFMGYGEKNAVLHMDNCAGQNKNNTVIGYGLWRTMTGLHDTLEFSMMEAGHTKFSPDWHFGLWKVRWRHSTVDSMEDIARTVRASSRTGHNIPHIVDDPEKPVVFYDWASFLKKLIKPVPNLLSYHHFRMTSDRPGVVFVRKYATDQEIEITVLRKGARMECQLPERLHISGLDPHRMWYLYEEVGPLCVNSSSACPQPTVPKPVHYSSSFPKKEKC